MLVNTTSQEWPGWSLNRKGGQEDFSGQKRCLQDVLGVPREQIIKRGCAPIRRIVQKLCFLLSGFEHTRLARLQQSKSIATNLSVRQNGPRMTM